MFVCKLIMLIRFICMDIIIMFVWIEMHMQIKKIIETTNTKVLDLEKLYNFVVSFEVILSRKTMFKFFKFKI
jgi:hypothetical protein